MPTPLAREAVAMILREVMEIRSPPNWPVPIATERTDERAELPQRLSGPGNLWTPA